MLRQRLLDALDSSSPLLFIEAIDGSGKSTVLSQWEDRGGGQGETRLRFDAQRLPSDPAALMRMFWSALRHRLRQDLPTLPAEDAQLEQALISDLMASDAIAAAGGREVSKQLLVRIG